MNAKLSKISKGNVYSTTLHVINSAIIKLSKLTEATTVYRGLSSRRLPKQVHPSTFPRTHPTIMDEVQLVTCCR